jgi:hypothetical protein
MKKMKKMKKNLMLFSVSLAILTGCQKQPVASLKVEGSDFMTGDEITIISTSKNAAVNEWHLPDGQKLKADILKYNPLNAGAHQIKLVSYSKNMKKNDETITNLNVVQAIGSAVFFTNTNWNCGLINVDVTDNPNWTNFSSGIISVFGAGTPGCGTPGNATFTLPVGVYYYDAYDDCGEWPINTFTISKRNCTSIPLN